MKELIISNPQLNSTYLSSYTIHIHTQNQFHNFLRKIEAARPSKSYNHYINSISHIHPISPILLINEYNKIQSQ